jgi:hypothetical protein
VLFHEDAGIGDFDLIAEEASAVQVDVSKVQLQDKETLVPAIRSLLPAGIPIHDEFHILNHWR